jgi:hypothetical protein
MKFQNFVVKNGGRRQIERGSCTKDGEKKKGRQLGFYSTLFTAFALTALNL